MNNEDYKKLSSPLPKEAIEKASKDVTRKGYDTTGYQYQYVVDRLNEVLGLTLWNFSYKILREAEGKYQSGQEFYDITVEVSINIEKTIRSCVGGHRSNIYADALKGAITNAFKKTAAFFGVGADAYRGTIDEDYRPGEPVQSAGTIVKTIPTKNNPLKTNSEAADFMDKALDMAMAMNAKDPKEAEQFLINLTAFEPKDKPGTLKKATWEQLYTNSKWAKVLYGKTKSCYEAWLKNETVGVEMGIMPLVEEA